MSAQVWQKLRRSLPQVSIKSSCNTAIAKPLAGLAFLLLSGGNAVADINLSELQGVTQVAAAEDHSCAIDANGVVCWGSNESGQLDAPATLLNPTQVVVGKDHSCALDDNGVLCWGSNADGQIDVPVGLLNPTQISAGESHNCALDDNGVLCWGKDGSGRLDVPVTLQNTTQVSAGGFHNCALDNNGVSCWGWDYYTQSTVPANLLNPTQVSAGGFHSCALDDNGVVCWGKNGYGQTDVPTDLQNPTQVIAGGDHTCAFDDTGIVCWGRFDDGQIVVPDALQNPTQLSAGAYHNCAIEQSGVLCWGYNASGQVTGATPFVDTPVILEPDDITTEATATLTPVTIGTATATDDIDTEHTVTADNEGPFPVGETFIVWSSTNSAGNTGTATQRVIITDTTAPVFETLENITVQATGELTTVTLPTVEATDLVDITVVAVPDNTGPFPVGVTTVTWTATDAAGNSSTTTQTVTVSEAEVIDTTPPTVTAPADIVMEATSTKSPVNLGTASATDLVDGTVLATADDTGPYSVGENTITWSATDAAGNTGTATQTVTITDNTPPTVTVSKDVTVEATDVLTPVNLSTAIAEDLVDGSVDVTPNTTGPFPIGVTLVTWTATDASGNEASAVQKITVTGGTVVVDTTPPTVTPPADITIEATGEATPVELGTASATDLVDGTIDVVTPNNNGPFPLGVTTVVWSATDAAGNTGTAEQTVTVTEAVVVDETPPTVTPPADITVEATGEETPVELGTASATDLVDGTIDVVTPNSNGPFPVGVNTVVWSATDAAGNTGTAEQTVTVTEAVVVDATPPIVIPPEDIFLEATGATTTVELGTASATDLVDGTIDVVTPDNEGPFAVGTFPVTWTATDAAGNTGTAEQTITITDETAPTVTPPENINVEVAAGEEASPELGNASAEDLVDGAITATADNTGPYPVGETTVTWTATDVAGNEGTATQTVTVTEAVVIDTTAPVVTAPADIEIDATGEMTEATLGEATATDDIDTAVAAEPDNLGPFPVGPTTITWTATDAAGNTGSDTQTVTVIAIDSDNDDVPDYLDAFPNDPTESADTDGDGVGDNADFYPTDPSRSVEGEGVFTDLTVNTEENTAVEQEEWNYVRLTGVEDGDTVTVFLDQLASDIDLYVRAGELPDLATFDCRSYAGGTADEQCVILKDAEEVFIGVYGYRAGNYRLSTQKELPIAERTIALNTSVSASLPLREWQYYAVEDVAAGAEAQVELDTLNADLDLYVKQGERPTLENFDCRSWNGGTTSETCAFTGNDTTTYIGVYAFAAGSYSLTVQGETEQPDLSQGGLVDGDVESGLVALQTWEVWELDGQPGDIIDLNLSGLASDIDLYTQTGAQPTLESFSCRSYNGGTREENCSVTLSEETTYVGVYGYEQGAFELSVDARPGATLLTTGQSLDMSIAAGEWQYFLAENPTGMTVVTAQLTGLTADIDLYAKQGTPPQLTDFECRSYVGGTSNEFCELNVISDTAYIGVYGYEAGDYTLTFTAQADGRAKAPAKVVIDKNIDIKESQGPAMEDNNDSQTIAPESNVTTVTGGGGATGLGLLLLPLLWVRRKNA